MTKQKRILGKSACKCAHCGKVLNKSTVTMDHFIPQSMGGTWDERNLFPLCGKCNHDRGDKLIDPNVFYKFADRISIWQAEEYSLSFMIRNDSVIPMYLQ